VTPTAFVVVLFEEFDHQCQRLFGTLGFDPFKGKTTGLDEQIVTDHYVLAEQQQADFAQLAKTLGEGGTLANFKDA